MNPAVLFHTCLVNEFCPDVGFAVVDVLERLGYEVDVPAGQTCCGQPAFNAGFHDDARAVARHAIAVLERTSGPIVIPSGSCGDMVTHQYKTLFGDEPDWHARAAAIAQRVVVFSAFVARHRDRLPPMNLDVSLAYHPSCHLLRGLRIDHEPRLLIDAIAGAKRSEIAAEDECCGFGGMFSVKHADISARMLERKLNNLAASGASRVVACDLGCLLHIRGGLERRGASTTTQHLAELIAEALR